VFQSLPRPRSPYLSTTLLVSIRVQYNGLVVVDAAVAPTSTLPFLYPLARHSTRSIFWTIQTIRLVWSGHQRTGARKSPFVSGIKVRSPGCHSLPCTAGDASTEERWRAGQGRTGQTLKWPVGREGIGD
jgi:hypothetical protein